MLTSNDIAKGVKITIVGNKPYRDISTPVSNAVKRDEADFAAHKYNLLWFNKQVNDYGVWNLKYREDDGNHWEDTLGISFWGYDEVMLLFGLEVKVEDVGNITYGYLGKAAGMANSVLIAGSDGNQALGHGVMGWGNEFRDEYKIMLGINWYNKSH